MKLLKAIKLEHKPKLNYVVFMILKIASTTTLDRRFEQYVHDARI